jgi:hypothetical protein
LFEKLVIHRKIQFNRFLVGYGIGLLVIIFLIIPLFLAIIL